MPSGWPPRNRPNAPPPLATALGDALKEKQADRTLPLLVKAREHEEAAKGSGTSPDLVERVRREVTEKELEATRAMAAARSKSSEEGRTARPYRQA
jgi:hypothetical protein